MAKKSSVAAEMPSQFAMSLLKSIAPDLVQSTAATSKKVSMAVFDPLGDAARAEKGPPSLQKSILNVLNGGKGKNNIERLAFESDPALSNQYAGLYKQKLKLLPDVILKRIMIQDDLVAAIVGARANQLATFGRPRPDRFAIGFVIEPREDILDKLDDDQTAELQRRIDAATDKLKTCGSTTGWHDQDRMNFSQYLSTSTRNAVGLGRIATEIIWVTNPETGKKEFHSFRPIDAGTIYRAAPHKEAAQQVREEAKHLIETLKNKKLEAERYVTDEYAWVQVIDGKPMQAFTAKECLVHNFYPVNDVELDGYPVTPLDTVISAVTTHINITAHNKLYFQSGRAARGMLVIKSDDIDEGVIGRIRQQFNASINSVSNAWRMPVFGIGSDDEITWQPIDSGQRDMEFQYLSDTNARVILSAFQMSPEELPGYAHLSRGTNNQALSESNQEYLLIAHRDVGIRPLLSQWQDFVNQCILPLIDATLAKICTIKFMGLDAETAEKESIRIQQDAPVHMTYDEVLDKVEKKPIGSEFGGEFPLNPAYQAILDKYLTVGQILERFFGMKGAAQDPKNDYRRDPFYFQQVQLQMQQQQMQMQAQQAAQGGGGQPPQGGGGGDDGGGSGGGGGDSGGSGGGDDSASANQQSASSEDSMAAQNAGQDLTQSVDQASAALGKHESQLPSSKRRLIGQHQAIVNRFMQGWKEESDEAIKAIVAVADKHAPRGK